MKVDKTRLLLLKVGFWLLKRRKGANLLGLSYKIVLERSTFREKEILLLGELFKSQESFIHLILELHNMRCFQLSLSRVQLEGTNLT